MQTHDPSQDRPRVGRGLDGDHAPVAGETGEEFGELPGMGADVDGNAIRRQERAETGQEIAMMLLGRRLPDVGDPREPLAQRGAPAHAVSGTKP